MKWFAVTSFLLMMSLRKLRSAATGLKYEVNLERWEGPLLSIKSLALTTGGPVPEDVGEVIHVADCNGSIHYQSAENT